MTTKVEKRTIGDIVAAVQEQQPATDEELRLTLLALYYFAELHAKSDYGNRPELALRMRAQHAFQDKFQMMKMAPDARLGPRWTPGTQENAEGRALSKRVAAAFEKNRGKP